MAAMPSLADRVLALVPGGPLLYARVDLVPGQDGAPLLMELEITEPCLFLVTSPGAAGLLADAVAARVIAGGPDAGGS